MKVGTASFGVVALLLVWTLDGLGVHLTPEAAAGVSGGVVTAVAWIIHHGGIDGLWKIIKGGKP